jgi:tetratricopeptide (TPR) repeat protein
MTTAIKIVVLLFVIGASSLSLRAQPSTSSTLLIKTSPDAIVWIDGLRYGPIPENGELQVKNLRIGAHTLLVRLKGKHEVERALRLATGENLAEIDLSHPADRTELEFQQAEELRERGKHAEAIKAYQAAIKSRPRGLLSARLGLARSMQVTDQYDEAYANLRQAMREKPGPFPEAWTIWGNLKRSQGFPDEAMKAYQTAVTQARGFSVEANTGLALLSQDRNQPAEAIRYLQKALSQANNTSPSLYFLLGTIFEREYQPKEAVAAYQKYLQLEPEGQQAGSAKSIIKQLKREIR